MLRASCTLILAVMLGSATPVAVAFEVYVSDAGNFDSPPWQILKFDENGENPQVFISEQLGWPQDIVFLESQGVVLISNLTTDRINRHAIDTGEFIDVFASNADGPTRMKIGPNGLLYVLQWQGDGRVLRYQPDGTFVDAFTDAGVTQAIGLDWDSEGRLYVSSFQGRSVRRFDQQGQDLGLFVNSNLDGPTNIWFGDDGDLFVVDWQGGAIRRFSDQGEFIETFAAGLSQPEGVARLPGGDLLIGNGGPGSVRRLGQNGESLGDFIAAGAGGLLQPNAVILRTPFEFDFLLDSEGQWVNDEPEFDGNAQGLALDYMAFADLVFVAWFTYVDPTASNPADGLDRVGALDNRWLTAQLAVEGNVAAGPMFASTGGRFDSPERPGQDTVEVGAMTIEFTSCDRAAVSYELDGLVREFPIVPLEKLVNGSGFRCASAATAAR